MFARLGTADYIVVQYYLPNININQCYTYFIFKLG